MNFKSNSKKMKAIFLFLLFLISMRFFSQDLHVLGHTIYDEQPLTDVKIKVMVGNKIFAETISDKKGFFDLKLDFNQDYIIYFEKESFQTMHANVDGDVPENKTDYRIKYEITIPLYHSKNKTVNLKTFDEKAFTRIYFDGKSKFIDDAVYLQEFLVALKTFPQEASVKEPVVEKKYRIAGKVLRNNASKSPYKLLKVALVDSNNKVIQTTLTNKFGVFSFSDVSVKGTYKVAIQIDNVEEKEKALIYNMSKELVAGPLEFTTNKNPVESKLEVKNTTENKLVERLITDNYIPFIAGKLTVEENGENTVLAEKTVYLYNDKKEMVEKTKTNVFGNFVFSKLTPDKNFVIALDEAEAGISYGSKIHLYSSTGVEIVNKDSLLKGKHLFNFLANDIHSYNDLLEEDGSIKMNLKGKLVGDNINNPLKNFKLIMLDKNYKIVDTVITDAKGDFHFKYLSYSKDLILRFVDTSSLYNYSSVILYDAMGNIVKYVSVKKGQSFDYKLLSGDIYRIGSLFVDDPWLSLSDVDAKKPKQSNLVIIENIYFESNKADLLAPAKQTLDKAILAMKSNPIMKIEISAHSDSKGSDDHNLKLSEKRAQSAKDYIISKGIDASRITAKGYGETKLLNKCKNNVNCTEDEHAKNRRLEFNIKMK